MSIKCLIIDDEQFARKLIASHLTKVDGFELMGECKNALDAANLLRKVKVDLIFLDIQMPEVSGLDFIKTLNSPPSVIFTTAHREFAADAFEINAVDYLVKPISLERFLMAVNKYMDRMGDHSSEKSLDANQSAGNFLYFKSDRKTIKLPTREIQYIESLDDYVKIHTVEKVWVTREKIGSLEATLPSPGFIRIHRSFIINTQYLTAFSGESAFLGQLELPFGRAFKRAALKILHTTK